MIVKKWCAIPFQKEQNFAAYSTLFSGLILNVKKCGLPPMWLTICTSLKAAVTFLWLSVLIPFLRRMLPKCLQFYSMWKKCGLPSSMCEILWFTSKNWQLFNFFRYISGYKGFLYYNWSVNIRLAFPYAVYSIFRLFAGEIVVYQPKISTWFFWLKLVFLLKRCLFYTNVMYLIAHINFFMTGFMINT